MNRRGCFMILVVLLVLCSLNVYFLKEASAQPILPIPDINIEIGTNSSDGDSLVASLQILLMLTVLSLVPAFLVLMTSFTRIVIVLGFTRNALATQSTPPNQIIIGLAILLTIFIMQPVFAVIQETAIEPHLEGRIDQETALIEAAVPLRNFMFHNTRERDLALFVNISGMEPPSNRDDIPLAVLVPAFVISELKTAFQMGFMIFLPFLVVDMVVASTLMSVGMFMLPPVMISLPFKILLFLLVDGWHLVVKSIVESFA